MNNVYIEVLREKLMATKKFIHFHVRAYTKYGKRILLK